MVSIKSLASDNLSFYRTLHNFERYGEINTVEDLIEYCCWAKENNVKVYILGNGSNSLFTKKNIKTLVLKNNLPKDIKPLPNYRLEVSSSVLVKDVLKYCYTNSLDSFYYLASVPATVGGALAMNAGRGRQYNCTIYDFVESITFFEDGLIKTLANDEVNRSYRQTNFTGLHTNLILSAVLKFNQKKFDYNPLVERIQLVKQSQDNTAPNCGSVFKLADTWILGHVMGLGIDKARFSSKTSNWILNESKSSRAIVILINLVKLLHFLSGKKIETEVITVD